MSWVQEKQHNAKANLLHAGILYGEQASSFYKTVVVEQQWMNEATLKGSEMSNLASGWMDVAPRDEGAAV